VRIAIASSGLGHVSRGIEAWASDLSRALWDRGIDARLYKGAGAAVDPRETVVPCWRRDEPKVKAALAFRRIGWRFGFGSPYAIEQRTFARNLLPRLRADNIDILHVQDPDVADRLERARNKGKLRTKTILAHGTEEDFAFLARFDYLQHLAPWHLEEARQAGFFKPTWTAIPNFLDTDTFRPGHAEAVRRELGLRPDDLVVLTSAAIRRFHKRIDYLIVEFARLLAAWPDGGRKPFLIVAGGREAETDELVAEGISKLGEQVRFLIRYPRERMPDLYRAADVFALGSLKEMMPIAVLEASATGLPCVVHDYPVLDWMTGLGGIRLDLSKPGTLSAGLTELFNRQDLRLSLGRASREHSLANFGREAVVDRILEYYAEVARHDPGASK
jgi:1,2-diacylglycerol 3-alpha-glucosyltransferase